jgi:hypothetical protein
MIKTDRNSVFLDHVSYIPDRLYIMVLYINFYEFYFLNFSSKSKVVRVRFYRKTQICGKNAWNSVFIDCEAHILNRLYIVVISISFYVFKKNQILAQNSEVLPFDFTESHLFALKTDKICILTPWGSYYVSVRYFSVAHKVLGVLKNIKFHLKTQRG